MIVSIDEQVVAPDQLLVETGTAWAGAGSGWETYPELLREYIRDPDAVYSAAQVNAIDVAELGVKDLALAVPAEQALPVYLRNQVAWKKTSDRAPKPVQ